MNENLNLVEILKDCPKGTKLYSTAFGDVYFYGISNNEEYPIGIAVAGNSDYRTLTCDGKLWRDYGGECILFPSKEQRDWSKFTAPWYKKDRFDPKTLKPFDKVLVRDFAGTEWSCDLFSYIENIKSQEESFICTGGVSFNFCIPYNDKTKYLVGTTKEAPEYYRYWEDRLWK